MRRSSRSLIGSWVLAVFALWLTPLAARAQSGSPLYDLVEQGRLALVEDKYAESLAALRKAMARPDFVSSDPGLQYFAYYLASFAAGGVDDAKAAHEFAMSATNFPDADGDTWMRRAGTAATLDRWDDAAEALLTIARLLTILGGSIMKKSRRILWILLLPLYAACSTTYIGRSGQLGGSDWRTASREPVAIR